MIDNCQLHFSHAALTHPGCVRAENQDNWIAVPEQGLYIVADGMGGQMAGALASKIVVETLPAVLRKELPTGTELAAESSVAKVRSALAGLSRDVFEQTQGQPGLAGMGATVVLALVRNDQALIAHLGDSRAYLFRGGKLECLTKDHSITQLLIESGEITPAEARIHPARGRVTRSVGMSGEPLPECRSVALQPGDRLLLCTDGLVGMIPDKQIQRILARTHDLPNACERLVAAANDAGGKDNITVLLVECLAQR